jgi:hypothetical protein
MFAMSPSMSALPPTANTLDPVQRSRLLRSTRKLGDVLGATPLIIDSESASRPGSPASRTKASVFLSHSHAASVTSLTERPMDDSPRLVTLNKHQKHKSKQLARPIVLCLSSLPAPPRRGSLTSSDVNNNDVPARRDTAPVQDAFLELDDPEKLLRRKRMAKLTRTLGANIPPELVFPHHYKSRSEPPQKLDKERASPKVSAGRGDPTTPDTDQRPNMNSKPIPIPTPPDRHTHKHRSLTVGTLSAATQNPNAIRRPNTSEANAENGGPFAFIHGPVPTSGETLVRDWRGEWSIRDADKRATALRYLKG